MRFNVFDLHINTPLQLFSIKPEKSKKLKVTWTADFEQDLRNYHNIFMQPIRTAENEI